MKDETPRLAAPQRGALPSENRNPLSRLNLSQAFRRSQRWSSSSMHRDLARMGGIALLSVGLAGCVLTPRGTDQEKARLNDAGKTFEPPVQKRELPELSAPPTWHDVLPRAFLANGDLEASYFDWKAA